MTLLLYYFAILLLHNVVYALFNVTVYNQNSAIQYSGAWNRTAPSTLEFGEHGLMVSSDSSAFATLTFTGPPSFFTEAIAVLILSLLGVAVYLWAPLWPYKITTDVCLDGGVGESVDLQDYSHSTDGGPETVASAVRWSRTGLTDSRHTLALYMGRDASYVVVDGF